MTTPEPTYHQVSLSDGCTLKVALIGSRTDTSRPLAIGVHGAFGLSSHTEPLISWGFLASKFRFLTFDLRGSGESEQKGPLTHERFVADIDELREWAGATKFLLTGGSNGGMLALDYAIKHSQEHLSGMAVCGIFADATKSIPRALRNVLDSPHVTVDRERQKRVWMGEAQSNEDLMAGLIEIAGIYQKPADVGHPPEGNALAGLKFYPFSASHNAEYQIFKSWNVSHRLQEIKTPTLVVVGKYDVICPPEDNEAVAKAIPGARYELFDQSGHLPPLEETDKWQSTIWNWIEENKVDL